MGAIGAPNAVGGCFTGLNEFHEVQALGCNGAISLVWDIPVKPVGSATTIASPTAQTTTFTPDIAGVYDVRLCATFETADSVDSSLPPPNNDLTLPCPHGAIAGEEIFIPLLNCSGVVQWTVTGAIISAQGNTTGVNIQLDPLVFGPVDVQVTCTETDINNNQTTQTLNCSFNTYDPETLVLTKSPTVKITSVLCGQYCNCIERRFVVKEDNPDDRCEYSEITITFRDCTQPTPEPCED